LLVKCGETDYTTPLVGLLICVHYCSEALSMHIRRAFTLIELLVVIAIIALLLAIIMPALNTVKEIAGAAVCASNARQVMTAWHMYATENDSRICGGRPYEYDPAGGKYDWVEGTNGATIVEEEINGVASDLDNQGIKGGSLYKYYENPKLLHCPTDKRFRKPATYPGNSGDGGYRTFSFIKGMGGSGSDACIKTTDIANPSAKYVLVEENDPRGVNAGTWEMDRDMNSLAFVDAFAVFHNMRSILGFADGHAEKKIWKDKRTEEFSEQISDPINGHFYSEVMNDNVDLQWLASSYAKKR
jgi:prepilin-type N-terminal cleavage/methylation domain-containing protein